MQSALKTQKENNYFLEEINKGIIPGKWDNS